MITWDPTIEPGDMIAVGDIHARYDLFEEFLNHVRASQATVILLGDIIDRGGQDMEVLDKVAELLAEPESEGLSNFFCFSKTMTNNSVLISNYNNCRETECTTTLSNLCNTVNGNKLIFKLDIC
jgi:Icc-related predicted phosphoesterase